jgi:hypothetical protein
VLNLDADRNKWTVTAGMLASCGLEFERFPAVDGGTEDNVAEWRAYEARGLELPLEQQISRRLIQSTGAWGYLKTMRGVLTQAKRNRYRSILVFDDDIMIHRQAREMLLATLAELPTDRPEDALKVGVVGELYVLMEPFSNFFVERELAKRGVEVHRFISVSGMLSHAGSKYDAHMSELLEDADPYLKYHVGAHGTESVAKTHKLMKEGFDGVLHLKPFGCMPEVNAMAALQRLSREHTFPVLFFSYDAQTSETGVQTRLEAFCDMLRMAKKARAAGEPAQEVYV